MDKKQQTAFMDSVDKELAKLKRIVEIINEMEYGAKERTIHYLISKYSEFVPNSDN